MIALLPFNSEAQEADRVRTFGIAPATILRNIEAIILTAQQPRTQTGAPATRTNRWTDRSPALLRLRRRAARRPASGPRRGRLPPYSQGLKGAFFAGTVNIELECRPEPGKIVEWVPESCTATDRLMQTTGIRE